MELQTLKVEKRENLGKGFARRLRVDKKVPAIFYGKGQEAIPVVCDSKELVLLLQGKRGWNTCFYLDIPGMSDKPKVICKDQHVHPIKRTIEHVDFFHISDENVLELEIPITVTGRSPAQQLGGKLTKIRNVVKVKTTAPHIPVFIEVNVDNLQPGSSILIGDVPFPEGVTPVVKSNFAVVSVTNPAAASTEASKAEEEAAAAV